MPSERADQQVASAKYLIDAASQILDQGDDVDIATLRTRIAVAVYPYGLDVHYQSMEDVPEPLIFGDVLKSLRVRVKKSQVKLAKDSHFSQSFISQLETSDRSPKTLGHVLNLVNALGLTVSDAHELFLAAGFKVPKDPDLHIES